MLKEIVILLEIRYVCYFRLSCCRGSSNVLLYCASCYLSKSYFFSRFPTISEPFIKKTNSHVIYIITRDVPGNYHLPVSSKWKFCIVRLSGRLVKFKAILVDWKLTSLRVSKGNSCFCFDSPIWKLIYQFWPTFLKCCISPWYVTTINSSIE